MSRAGPAGLRLGAAACLLLWAVSLALPAVDVAGGPTLSGAAMLERGWRAIDAGVLAWYANPLFLLACAMASFAKPRASGVLSGVALVLALTTFAATDVAGNGGGSAPEVIWQSGFYCWLAAQIGLLAWSWSAVLVTRDSAAQ